MTRDQQIAWAAGFLDGEGWMGRHGRGYPVIEASQIVPEPLDRLHALFGGTRCTKNRPTKSGNAVYFWRISCEPAALALRAMLPFFVVKKERANTVLREWDSERHLRQTRSAEAKERIAVAVRSHWASLTPEERFARGQRAWKTRRQNMSRQNVTILLP